MYVTESFHSFHFGGGVNLLTDVTPIVVLCAVCVPGADLYASGNTPVVRGCPNPPDAISIDHRLDADPGPRFIYGISRHALPQFVAGFGSATIREILYGVGMGITIRLMLAIEAAGAIAGINMGLSLNVFVDPTGRGNDDPGFIDGSLWSIDVSGTGWPPHGHRALLAHFRGFPIGETAYSIPDSAVLMKAGRDLIHHAFIIASPVIVVTLLLNMSLALVSSGSIGESLRDRARTVDLCGPSVSRFRGRGCPDLHPANHGATPVSDVGILRGSSKRLGGVHVRGIVRRKEFDPALVTLQQARDEEGFRSAKTSAVLLK